MTSWGIYVGTCTISLKNLLQGVSLYDNPESSITFDHSGIGSFALTGKTSTVASTYSNMQLVVDDTTSDPFMLTINKTQPTTNRDPLRLLDPSSVARA